MTRDPVPVASSLTRAMRTFRRPWPILLAGLACTILALMMWQFSFVPLPLRVMTLGAGILLAGIAVSRRLQTAGWELEDRTESAGLLAVAAFVALLAYKTIEAKEKSWDSALVFFGALIGVALVGSFLVLLPRTGRRIAALLLLLFHFGGILTAVTAVPPRNEPAPWISMQLWTHVYRHYLGFAYLTNAYHFYSPDPGPPTLLWFHVEYADGKACWIKIPNRSESPVGLHHQRMLAAAENAFNPIPGLPVEKKEQFAEWEKKFKHKYELMPGIPHPSWEDIQKRRRLGTLLPFTDPEDDNRLAYLRIVEDELVQYSEPQEMARRLLASYAQHIAHTTPDPQNPDNEVKSVRIYRVIHTIITPSELNAGKLPLDPTTFMPFYMGKYDPDGRLLDPRDHFLFWYVPIIKVSKRFPEEGTHFAHSLPPPEEPTKIIDFVEIHATQSDKFQMPSEEK